MTDIVLDTVDAEVSNQLLPELSLQGKLESAIALPYNEAKTLMNNADTSATVKFSGVKSTLSGSMKNIQLVNFEESPPKKKRTSSNAERRDKKIADQNSLFC